MNNAIVKTFFGKHIDLSKVVSISDAYFIDRMGSGGYYVGFDIEVQLMENPIHYRREFKWDEKDYEGSKPKVKLVNGKLEDAFTFFSDKFNTRILAVNRLQKQVDELIEQWKQLS